MSEKKISRRRFLGVLGVLGGGIAACGITGYIGTRFPRLEVPTSKCKDADGKRILVTYASRVGATLEVAEFITAGLCKIGYAVDIEEVSAVRSLQGYAGVVLGSAIYMNKMLGAAINFLSDNQVDLQQIPLALFTTSLTMKDDTPENRQLLMEWTQPARDLVAPATEAAFGGVLDSQKLPFLYRLIISSMGEEDGDFRDWDAIQSWVDALPTAFA